MLKGKDYHHNLHHNIVWLHIPVVFCYINASHKYFFSQRQVDIYTYSTTKHTLCITTIAYDKSVFPYCEKTFYKVRTGGETNDIQGCKQGGRRNATKTRGGGGKEEKNSKGRQHDHLLK